MARGGERDVTAGSLGPLADDVDNLLPHRVEPDTHGLERFGSHTFALVDQPEKNVLCADVVVIEKASFLLSQHDDPPSPLCESLKHLSHLSDNSGESCEDSPSRSIPSALF